MSVPMKPVELTVVDTNTAEWQDFPVEYINANLEHVPLVSDPETGMMVLRIPFGWLGRACALGPPSPLHHRSS